MSVWETLRWKTLGFLGRVVLRAWAKTSRILVLGEDEYQEIKRAGKPIILLIWHGRLMLVPYFFRKRGIAALVSPSRDGEIIARIGEGWGYRILRGSSSHAMVRAWVEMREELAKGGELIIIPDGPRGPDRRLKSGCIKLAQETGALLVPWSFSATRKRHLGSWDRFLFFYPFSRVVAIYGNPLTVPPVLDEAGFEAERQRVERALTLLDAEADSRLQ